MADTAVTLSDDRISRLTAEEQAAKGYNLRIRIPYTDVNQGSGSTDTVTVTIGATPAKWLVDHCVANVTTAFAGTGAFTMKVGATDDDAFLTDTTVMTAGPIMVAGCVPAASAGSEGIAAQTIKAIFTNATSGSPSALTAGEVVIYLRVIDTAADLA